MAAINVYRYDFYDPLLKRERRSIDFATGDAISAMGAKALAETLRTVDESLVDDEGIVRAIRMPPREIVERSPARGWEARP